MKTYENGNENENENPNGNDKTQNETRILKCFIPNEFIFLSLCIYFDDHTIVSQICVNQKYGIFLM